MSIINDFILDHQSEMTDKQMAVALGMYQKTVKARRIALQRSGKRPVKRKPVNEELPDELLSLIYLVELRQTGWAADVARQRIETLRKFKNTY